MRTLAVSPDRAAYSVSYGASFAESSLDGGASRQGARPRGAASEVECTWTASPLEYAYLRAFFRTTLAQGSLPFSIALAVDGAVLEDYVAVLVPGTFGLRSTSGDAHVVSARLAVSRAPTAATDAYSAIVSTLLSEVGGPGEETSSFGLLAELVNEDLP